MIVVAGEALVDVLVAPSGEAAVRLGGGPFNVARTIARLEAPATFAGPVSEDGFGTRLRAALDADGVAMAVPEPTRAPTTLAVAELDAAGSATYRFYVEGTSAPALTAEGLAGDLLASASALHVGTLGLVLEPMATTIERLVAAAPPDCLVMVDPNCRPVAIADGPAYRARLARVLARADVVQLSRDDAAYLEPGTEPEAVARRVLSGGPSVVLLTDGGRPVVALTAGARLAVPVPAGPIVDTVGAGDSFGGAFLAWWWHAGLARVDLDDAGALRPAVESAVDVSARTCQRAGADPPRRSELFA